MCAVTLNRLKVEDTTEASRESLLKLLPSVRGEQWRKYGEQRQFWRTDLQ